MYVYGDLLKTEVFYMSTFHLVIKDLLSSSKIEEARSAQGAALYPRFTSDVLVLCPQVKF